MTNAGNLTLVFVRIFKCNYHFILDDVTTASTQSSLWETSPAYQHETTPLMFFWQLCLAIQRACPNRGKMDCAGIVRSTNANVANLGMPNTSESPNVAEECFVAGSRNRGAAEILH